MHKSLQHSADSVITEIQTTSGIKIDIKTVHQKLRSTDFSISTRVHIAYDIQEKTCNPPTSETLIDGWIHYIGYLMLDVSNELRRKTSEKPAMCLNFSISFYFDYCEKYCPSVSLFSIIIIIFFLSLLHLGILRLLWVFD